MTHHPVTPNLEADLLNRFTYHAPHGNQTDRYQMLRSQALDLALAIAEKCPPSRERSLAFTALEEAVMWANASIARNEDPPDEIVAEVVSDSKPKREGDFPGRPFASED
jgi:hypothetical protein